MKLNFKEKYLIILVICCFITVGFYYSYAIFVTKQLQENVVVIKTINNDLSLKVNGRSNEFEISPNEKQDIMISFSNNDSINYYYLVLVKGIKTGIKISSDDLVKGIINGKENKNLKVHINNETSEKVKLEFMVQISNNENIDKTIGYSYINKNENYDHSGANKPDINNLKLIPVSYHKNSDKEGYWYKSDKENTSDIWYNYDNGIWANAILVSNDNYQKYQKQSIGSEIDISDVLGFFVWIPRFKYSIINNSNYTNYERMSNVIFESKNNSTGTVTCIDKISDSSDAHIYSEVCNDSVYNHIYDDLSTYTHPAFQDKNGFWISKFLMSEGEKVLPNVHILKKNINDANIISSNYSKSHILTNMEYAAVIILSNSQYGKTGNPLYNSNDNITFTRIYGNNYEHEVTGCSSEYNSYSKNILTEKTNKCLEYNDLTNASHYSNSVYYPIGYVGAGSSSTGEVYGVYDLANISGELVAAYIANSDGTIDTNLKYYDKYSYNDYIGKVASSSNIHNLYRYKLGDAIRENFRTFSENGMWNGGVLLQNKNTGILVRGGNTNPSNTSVYTTSIEDVEYEAPFRIVLEI